MRSALATWRGKVMADGRGWALKCFVAAAVGLLFGSAVHLAVLVAGHEWIAFVGAPKSVVLSAEQGTWLAPVGAIGIAALLAIWAAYALAGAGLIRRLPFLRTVLVFVCILFGLRGLLILPLLMAGRVNWRALPDLFIVGSSVFIFLISICIAIGLTALRQRPEANSLTS